MKLKEIKNLVKLANSLDSKGLYGEADIVDGIIYKMAEEDGFEPSEVSNKQEESQKKKIYVLVGPPAVGKSTWINSTFKGDEKPYVINRDDIVEQVASSMGWTYDDLFTAPSKDSSLGDIHPKFGQVVKSPDWMTWQPLSYSIVKEANDQVAKLFNSRVSGATSYDGDIVVDMTNMNSGARKGALKAVAGKESDYLKIAVVFPFQGAEKAIKQVSARRAEEARKAGKSKTIPPDVMDRMMGSFQPPSLSEGFDAIVEFDNRAILEQISKM